MTKKQQQMTQLGDRNYVLILNGIKTAGTYNPDEIFFYFEEQLYVNEVHEIYEFLKWVHETGRTFGHGNYEEVFSLFKKEKE